MASRSSFEVAKPKKERTSMRIRSVPKEIWYVAKHRPVALSAVADGRLQKLKLWKVLKEKQLGEAEIQQLLRVSRSSLYRWQKQLREKGPKGLEVKSRRPHRLRHREWGQAREEAVLELREAYPGWGKDKLAVLLRRKGLQMSASTVGRILVDLKERGWLPEVPVGLVKIKKRPQKRTYAIRKPRNYQVQEPGDLVQVDTLEVRPLDETTLKHFTARDVISRWDLVEAHRRATVNTASEFLETILARMPFLV